MPQEDYKGEELQTSQGQNTDGAGGEAASHQGGDQQDQRMVPLEVVQSMRDELKDAKERARRAEYFAQQGQQQQQQQQSQKSTDPLDEMEEDDFLTAGQARKIIQRQQQQSEQVLREMQLRQQTPDYDDVIKNDLPKLVEQKPHLRDAILSSQDPYSLAYELGRSYRDTQGAAQQQQSQEGSPAEGTNVEQGSELNQALQKQQQTPGSPSQAARAQRGTVSQESRYDTMSPEEFEEEIRKVRRGA